MFYGWKLCFVTLMGNLLLQGSLVYMMNAFIDPLTVAHGWTRPQVSFGMSIGALLGGLSSPVWSSLSLRFSLRILMTVGAFIGGSSLIMLGLTSDILMFYVFYSLAWISGQAFGGTVGIILMNQWFSKERGRAFGLCNVGTSFSGAVLPFVLLIVITTFNVQTAWISYGLILLCFVPICWIFVRDKPEMLGLHVDNITPDENDAPSQKPVPVSFDKIFRNKDVYILGLSFGFTFMVVSSVISQLKPRMVDMGLDSYTAMTFSCLTALFLAIAKYFWGKACDKYNTIKVTRALFAAIFASLLLIFVPLINLYVVFLFSICFGITAGGAMTVLPAAVAFYFGKDSFVFYYRVISTVVLLKALGYSIIALSLHYTGSYDFAYSLFCGVLVLCFASTFLLSTSPPYLNKESQ